MLSVERLSLTLPAGFDDRAAGIAELLAQRLAALPLPAGGRLEHLRLEYVLDTGEISDAGLADALAVALHRRLAAGVPVRGARSGGEG